MWHYQIKDINNPSMIFEPNLIPRACFSLVSTKNTASGCFWPDPKQEVCAPWTFGSSTQTQKFEAIGVVNGFKNLHFDCA